MITVVSPRLTLLEVVVTVRVTLHAVSITERPIARAIKRPLPGLSLKHTPLPLGAGTPLGEGVITPLLFIVFIVLFIVLTNCNHSPPSPSGVPEGGVGGGSGGLLAVVLGCTDVPEVLVEGLVTGVLLSIECIKVGGNG